jgi:hypothetical protein
MRVQTPWATGNRPGPDVSGDSSRLELRCRIGSCAPHLHMIVLDDAWCEKGGELAWEGLGHFRTSEVGEVLERLVRRMGRHLRRRGLLRTFEDEAEPGGEGDLEGNLAASAVWGQAPPAGPQWMSRLAPLEPRALAYDKPLCASLDGFTLHAATRAALSTRRGGRLCCVTCCVLRSRRSA